jgi:hypothetical protein
MVLPADGQAQSVRRSRRAGGLATRADGTHRKHNDWQKTSTLTENRGGEKRRT